MIDTVLVFIVVPVLLFFVFAMLRMLFMEIREAYANDKQRFIQRRLEHEARKRIAEIAIAAADERMSYTKPKREPDRVVTGIGDDGEMIFEDNNGLLQNRD